MNLIFAVVLGFSVLVDLALAAWAGVAWGPAEHGIPSFVSFWLPSLSALPGPAAGEVRLLGLVLALCLLAFAALQGLALRWVLTENEAGHRVAIVFGLWLVVSSLAVFLAFQRWEFLLVDGLRGAALAVLGVVALQAPATVRELRLPDKPRDRRAGGHRPGERDARERRRTGLRDRGERPPGSDRGGRRDRLRERGPRGGRPPDRRRDPSVVRVDEPERSEREHPVEESDRSLRVVIHGAPERMRSVAHELAERSPDVTADRSSEREGSDGRSRRRRRRRTSGDGLRSVAPGASDLSEAAGAVREPAGEELPDEPSDIRTEARSGGERAVRSRRRRRRRPPADEDRREPGRATLPDLDSASPERSRSPVEALDMLSLLEPVSRREAATEPFGRGRRPALRGASRSRPIVPPKPAPGPASGDARTTVPPPSVRPDYGREEAGDSDREPD